MLVKRIGLHSEFVKEAKDIIKRVDSMTRLAVKEEFSKVVSGIQAVTARRYLILNEAYQALKKEYLSPSMFISYRNCARALAIEVRQVVHEGGKPEATVEQMRAMLRGVLVHDLWFRKYAIGEVEPLLVSEKLRMLGYPDEVRKEPGAVTVIEVKSGHNPDLVGSALQVMAYMKMAREVYGVEEVKGLIITLKGTYEVVMNDDVFDLYYRRLRTVVEDALNGADLPPRLSSSLAHRCRRCPYRGLCFSLPDRYRTYENYFREKSLLADRPKKRTLFDFFTRE